MSMRDLLHEVKFSTLCDQIDCTDAAAINAASPNSLDTQGYESNMIMLGFADTDTGAYDMVFQMYESDTSVTHAGSACAAADVVVMREDGVKTKCPAATGILTMDAVGDDDFVYLFQYVGKKRWVRLTATVGTVNVTPSMIGVQAHARRQPPYA